MILAEQTDAGAGFAPLITRSPSRDWPSRFRIRGREYVIVPGSPSTITYARGARPASVTLRAWSAARRRELDITITETDHVEVLTYVRAWDSSVEITPAEAGIVEGRVMSGRSAADPRVESRESATKPECAVCHTTGYWVGWLPKAGEYRCINHNKTKEEPHAG